MKYAKDRNLLDTRILTASIGFCQGIEFDYTAPENQNPPLQFKIELSAWTPNQEIITDDVRWVFYKGETVEQDCTSTFRGTRALWPLNGSPITISEDFYCSPVTGVGEYIHPVSNNTYAPLEMKEAQISKMGSLEFTIEKPSAYPRYKSTKRSLDGKKYAEVEYEIAVRWAGLRLYWTLTIPASGHFDCDTDIADCPGQFHRTTCPGYAMPPLSQESRCNLGAAFGAEQASGPVEDVRDSFDRAIDSAGLETAERVESADKTYQAE